jgi:hypothetical protein
VVEFSLPTGVKLERSAGGKASTQKAAEILSQAGGFSMEGKQAVVIYGGSCSSRDLLRNYGKTCKILIFPVIYGSFLVFFLWSFLMNSCCKMGGRSGEMELR